MIKAAIMEVNPFHNGHAYFLSQIPKSKDDILIVIISTSIVQRGEFTILNKHDKAKLLLDHHADIVIALPSILANQGGDYFAHHALKILNQLEIDCLYFGSESANLDFLMTNEFHRSNNFARGIYRDKNENFKANDILGVSYLKAINKINPNIQVNLVKRISNDYNDLEINSQIASATSIRKNINKTELIKNVMPSYSQENLQNIDTDLLFSLFKHQLNFVIDTNFNIFLSENNQLLQRLDKLLRQNPQISSLEQLALLAQDKNNSKYKYQRIMINTIFLVEQNFDFTNDFIHLLGFTSSGQKYLKTFKNLNIITTLKNQNSPLALLEKRVTQTYNLITKQSLNHDYQPPVINCDKINE